MEGSNHLERPALTCLQTGSTTAFHEWSDKIQMAESALERTLFWQPNSSTLQLSQSFALLVVVVRKPPICCTMLARR
jgi:hypothetical protein